MKVRELIIKDNGLILFRGNLVKLVSDTPYLSNSDGCLLSVLDSNIVEEDYNTSANEDKQMTSSGSKATSSKKAFSSFSFSNQERATELIESIRDASSMEELDAIYHNLMRYISLDTRQTIEELHNKYPELVLSIMVKTIVTNYVKSQLARNQGKYKEDDLDLIGVRKKKNKIVDWEVRKAKGESINRIMREALSIDSYKRSNNDVDLLLAKTLCDQLDNYYMKLSSQCYYCRNGTVLLCDKVARRGFTYESKGDIGDEEMNSQIISGFQLLVDGQLDEFRVFDCDHFADDSWEKPLTRKEASQLQRKVNSIRTAYYGVETTAQADAIEKRNKALGFR